MPTVLHAAAPPTRQERQLSTVSGVDKATGYIAASWYDCRNARGEDGHGCGRPDSFTQFWATYSTDGGARFAPGFGVSRGHLQRDGCSQLLRLRRLHPSRLPVTPVLPGLVRQLRQHRHQPGRQAAQARLREEQLDFLAGQVPGRALAAKTMVGDSTTLGDIRRIGDALLLLVDPKRSDPKEHAEMTKTLHQWAAGDRPGGPLGFELIKRVQVVRARLSHVPAQLKPEFGCLCSNRRKVCR